MLFGLFRQTRSSWQANIDMENNNGGSSLRTKWGSRFILSTIIQGGAMTALVLPTRDMEKRKAQTRDGR